jgi:dipeptidase
MHGIPIIGTYPPKHNNNVGDVGIKFSRQIDDHIVKGPSSSGRHLSNTKVCTKEYALQRVWWMQRRRDPKALVDSIDQIQATNLQFEEQWKITQCEIL